MRFSIALLVAFPLLARAQFGANDNGGLLDDSVKACTEGNNPVCTGYLAVANNCYEAATPSGGSSSDSVDEAAGLACLCTEDSQAAFSACAQCVIQQAGESSDSASVVMGYQDQIRGYCNGTLLPEDETTSSSSSSSSTISASSSSSSSSATSSVSSSLSSSSVSRSSSASSTSASASASASAPPTGTAPRQQVLGAAGLLGAVGAAWLLFLIRGS